MKYNVFVSSWRGLEIWNPDTGAVSTITSLLPQESSSSSPLNKFTMVSIKNNSEILIIGGKLGGSYISGAKLLVCLFASENMFKSKLCIFWHLYLHFLSDVWNYNYSNNSWIKIGNLIAARSEHVALTETGLKCP